MAHTVYIALLSVIWRGDPMKTILTSSSIHGVPPKNSTHGYHKKVNGHIRHAQRRDGKVWQFVPPYVFRLFPENRAARQYRWALLAIVDFSIKDRSHH